ncbi:hypothetical protein [Croceicoccus sp. YJ47]|uniref:hypothetical protein n=1 Tax=Croceicoccus sp. YJ47 TaxID=2798724 RepID=UPI001920E2F4|nr:hypothetical protein [Croceicoccus sp. YJ47]QQN74247.1 hypothetical protein JD971_00005 [Croceicoccus sp. YJ47]
MRNILNPKPFRGAAVSTYSGIVPSLTRALDPAVLLMRRRRAEFNPTVSMAAIKAGLTCGAALLVGDAWRRAGRFQGDLLKMARTNFDKSARMGMRAQTSGMRCCRCAFALATISSWVTEHAFDDFRHGGARIAT